MQLMPSLPGNTSMTLILSRHAEQTTFPAHSAQSSSRLTDERVSLKPNDEHQGRGEAIRKARQAGLEQARNRRFAWHRQQRQNQPHQDPNDVV